MSVETSLKSTSDFCPPSSAAHNCPLNILFICFYFACCMEAGISFQIHSLWPFNSRNRWTDVSISFGRPFSAVGGRFLRAKVNPKPHANLLVSFYQFFHAARIFVFISKDRFFFMTGGTQQTRDRSLCFLCALRYPATYARELCDRITHRLRTDFTTQTIGRLRFRGCPFFIVN